ncbi:MAG: hypothetical protein CO140_03610 [Candidatus Moranbacteria bacterium CG_4_9_14_3_um_filter_40_7]|nr:MAG: hypothetical protein COX31_04260 [Candidatus Moranbacteria bacterium CG23_combo_of_CG06-09_8_20_14_all_40_16]PIU81034.1 MAG: hypothetical protein COS71_00365 [Candidatus Moranbacteria bacterium CG06_land_8_20_14_3_00_40_12]PJA87578.1 MAG: hypothetical protein CO140_03610 [Candidatus Moranbacteria bacterium CG_4_9_14_3_um_filter_40_7]
MKAYITCPCSHSQNRLNLLPIIEAVAKNSGLDTFVFEIGGTPEEIFNRDYSNIKDSDLIIAEVSERNHGVGIEIGMSYCLGLKRILLLHEQENVTKLAQGMPDTTIIRYKDEDDLKTKLEATLSKIMI